MSSPILSVAIHNEHDTVTARQRARQIARLLGFDPQDQTRISTAVSEIARNAFNYASGGRVEYLLEGRTAPQLFIVRITDAGPGIRDLNTILEGRYQSKTGMGLGIIGARRLMDQFQIDSVPGRGTTVWLKKLLSKRASLIGAPELGRISASLIQERPQNAFEELQHQNQELLGALEEIRSRQAELIRLNRELEDTNRGVVALYAELDEKADHLRRADELKSKFLSNMSHEFRSPLNSILALSGLLLNRADGDLTSAQNQQVVYVKKAAQDLLELVNDLLDLAKVEAGKVEVRPLEFEVENLFAALRGMLRPLLLNQAVDLIFDDASHIPRVFSDEGKVSQILRNFISNALKFTERGEIRVSAALTGDHEISLSVTDTGIGIAPENIDLIFQDFTQVDHPIQKRVRGTGLGLPLSKKLATVLGGSVGLRSQLGSGSEFSLRIPIRYRSDEPEADDPGMRLETSHDPSRLPVLVVDDRPEMMIMYRSYLAGTDFEMWSASTTREAEEVLDRVRPAVIILDIILRAEDSWAFLARLKNNDSTRDIPVLVASTIEDRNKGFHLGANSYILKPFGQSDLIRELKMLTGKIMTSKVLIIDDQERDRYLLKQRLGDLPLLIMEAPGGIEGLRLAAEKPDAIFLDLSMPGMSGFEVLEKLKNEDATATIPVIIVTSLILSDAESQKLSEHAVVVVQKDRLEQTDFAELLRGVAAS